MTTAINTQLMITKGFWEMNAAGVELAVVSVSTRVIVTMDDFTMMDYCGTVVCLRYLNLSNASISI